VKRGCRVGSIVAAASTAFISFSSHADTAFHASASIDETVLDDVRGGFEIPAGLHAALQLERVAFVNGERVAHLSVDIPDIGRMTAEQANALAHAAGQLVIQNGVDNTVAVSAFENGALAPATFIQNTLNDQHLVSTTSLNVEVNSLGAFRELNFLEGLNRALGAVGVVR
jgi:hypothetical protein